MTKKLKTYHVYLPRTQLDVYAVKAYSKKEIKDHLKAGKTIPQIDSNFEQLYSNAGQQLKIIEIKD